MLRCTKVIKTTDSGGFLLDMSMKAFFLNFTRIVETNPRIYWSIIFGLAACLALFVAEIVHIQLVINELKTKDQNVLAEAICPWQPNINGLVSLQSYSLFSGQIWNI